MQTKPDLPFYNDQPVAIAPLGWLAVVASVALAFWLLTNLPFTTVPLNFIPAIVFTGLPLLVLGLASKGHHTALFRRFGLKQLAIAVGFGLLTIASSFLVAGILFQFVEMTPNAAVSEFAASTGPVDVALFLARTFIQLIGEELVTILPLLAILWLCVAKLNFPRTVGLVIAVILTTAWFAALHLPTYNWNFIQCFGAIGTARLVLTIAFLVTRNLWVSAGAHIFNDWSEFFGTLGLSWMMSHTPIDPAA